MNFIEQKNRKAGGIILCTYIDGVPKFLLVKKRVTRYYCDFVLGRYPKNDEKYLTDLFNNMTVNEKCIILSEDFSKIWFHIWLKNMKDCKFYNNKMNNLYTYCRTKYERFITYYNSRNILYKNYIRNSKSKPLTWDIPKGKLEPNETYLEGAIREFEEESNIRINKYQIITDKKPLHYSHIFNNINYINKYFVAKLNPNSIIREGVSFSNNYQRYEIADTRFFSLHELNYLELNNKGIKKLLKKAVKIFKNKTKKFRQD
jgi:8-oxo-dGTP pyrophosphatase MutT (NUDIX family)